MLKRKENNDKITISKKELGLFIIIIILAMILCIVASRFISDKIELSNKNTISLSDKLSQIKDNYDITVTKNENDTKTIYTIMCDSDICLYKNNDLEYKELLEYKGKYYTLDQMTDIDNAKLIEVKTDIINTSLNKKYYNLNLIKNVIETSSRDKNEDNKIEAHSTLIRYLKEYNYEYNEINKVDSDINIPIIVVNGTSTLRSIMIDYKEIDKYFNNTSYETLTYTIAINSVGNIDLKEIKEYIENNM